MRSRVVALALLVASALLAWPRAQSRPNVLLITLDTTRADRMGFLGSTHGLTPALDALARGATVFTRAYAQAPITTVSHATILTGLYPPSHHVGEFGAAMPASVPYLPALFKTQGYRTAAFVGSLVLDPRSGTAPGFDRGFDVYDAGFRRRNPGEDRYATLERRGVDVAARAMAWMKNGTAALPFFIWVHLFDPHDPYDPPGDLKARFPGAPYDAEIASVDRAAGELVAAAGRDAVVAIAADHGESLGDHGESTHGVFLYDATLHVPLVIRLPQGRGAGARVNARVRLADVAPTLLDAAAIAVPPAVEGETLLPLATADAKAADRPVYAETFYPRQAFGWSPLVSWRADRFLYVRAPQPELYDLVADPAAAKNLAATRGRIVDGMDAEVAAFIRGSDGSRGSDRLGRSGSERAGRSRGSGGSGGAGRSSASGQTRIDPAVAERLAALGYASGSGGATTGRGVDPKDRIATANLLHDAMLAVDDGAFARAIPLLEKVAATEPDIPIAQLSLGVARARQRQHAQAIAPLTRAVALLPGDMRAQYELGAALYETGDLKGAAGRFATVAAAMPAWADARYSLGSVYARIDRVADAVTELRAAIALEPRHFRANLLLGRVLALQGDAASAIPYLRTAVDVQPNSLEAKQFLADALKK
jgi:arylsulfatase A-like enzyme/Flp pilus assembly protein TadD